jgi:hypothetical protein
MVDAPTVAAAATVTAGTIDDVASVGCGTTVRFTTEKLSHVVW